MKDPTSCDRTLKQGRSRFWGAWGFYIFNRERWKEFPLVKGILHKCFLGIRKNSQHILIVSNGKYHKSHNKCKNTDICNYPMHFHNIFSYIFCLHPQPSLYTTILRSIFRGRSTRKQVKLQLQVPSLPQVPRKALYQFCNFFNSHHKRKKKW